MMLVVSSKQKGDTKGTESTILSITLFVVAHVFDKLFDGNGFLILILIPSCSQAGLINENIGVGRQSSNIACGVMTKLVRLFRSLMKHENMSI